MRLRRGEGRRRGATLVELLLVTLLVGLVAARALRTLDAVAAEPGEATRGLCEANKRNLRVTLEAWSAANPGSMPPVLPGVYPALQAAGLLRAVPCEPATRAWKHTYVSGADGQIVCRLHDLGVRREGELPRSRILALEVLAFTLVIAAWVAVRLIGLEPVLARRAAGPVLDAATRAGIVRILRQARARQQSTRAEVRCRADAGPGWWNQ